MTRGTLPRVAMLSQFFILSPRGDAVVSKDFRRDLSRRTHETFYRLVRFWRDEDDTRRTRARAGRRPRTRTRGAPAAFHRDGVNYMHIKASGLYFVSTTTSNASPSAVLELMHRLARLVKDVRRAHGGSGAKKHDVGVRIDR